MLNKLYRKRRQSTKPRKIISESRRVHHGPINKTLKRNASILSAESSSFSPASARTGRFEIVVVIRSRRLASVATTPVYKLTSLCHRVPFIIISEPTYS
jgi:hypothetical protein